MSKCVRCDDQSGIVDIDSPAGKAADEALKRTPVNNMREASLRKASLRKE